MTTEEQFTKQYTKAWAIMEYKRPQWYAFMKETPEISEYAGDLFDKRYSFLSNMLTIDPERGFLYDPATLEQGIDVLMQIYKTKTPSTVKRLESMYRSFATPYIRISYLKSFIFRMNLTQYLARAIHKDALDVLPTLTDPDEIEIFSGLAAHMVTHLKAIEEKDKKDFLDYNPNYFCWPEK